MALFIHRKERHIVEDIKRHVDLVVETVKEYIHALNLYLDGCKDESKEYTKKVHKVEEEADSYKRKISKEMFDGAFMPSLRESLYVAIDFIDHVANEAETSGDILTLIEPEIPKEIVENIKKMSELTVQCAEKLKDGVYNLFENIDRVFEDMKEVERLEGEVDKYVWKTLETVFKELKIQKFSVKLLLREFIIRLNLITNKMEDASDKIDLIALRLKN
jgi:predicted phosphate transport protein (TIGR00153 family)